LCTNTKLYITYPAGSRCGQRKNAEITHVQNPNQPIHISHAMKQPELISTSQMRIHAWSSTAMSRRLHPMSSNSSFSNNTARTPRRPEPRRSLAAHAKPALAAASKSRGPSRPVYANCNKCSLATKRPTPDSIFPASSLSPAAEAFYRPCSRTRPSPPISPASPTRAPASARR
jgi:hypothetical protein